MRSVAVCGSRRFEKEIRQFAKELKQAGIVVFEPHLHQGGEEWQKLSDKYKSYTLVGLTRDHFHKIALADVVYVFNQDGYSGNSTTLELGYAVALNKPIYARELDSQEGCRQALFQEIVYTSHDLLAYLQ